MEYNEFFVRGLACLGAGIAALTGSLVAVAEGMAASKAVEAVGKNPEAVGSIRSVMVLGIALSETTGIYALVVALLLIFLKG
ncbi:MAG: ATP synthase F0 subunit C [Erysipelotrichaceae bacterium]|nr:ATP synthase F0 subunit C [Erysipelotrichaceae bacterium]